MILDDKTLIEKTDRLAKAEKELLTNLLKHFAEIERRRLYSTLKYTSLFNMIVQRYGFSEDEANLRVAACRLLNDLPEIEDKVSAGEISITHMAMTQRLFRKEKKLKNEIPRAKKLEILDEVAATPLIEARRILAFHSSENKEHLERYFFEANEELQNKIQKAQEEFGVYNIAELVGRLCDIALKRPKIVSKQKFRVLKSKAQIYREVRSRNTCENCGSRHHLQVDHIIARGKGGLDTEENLRLLCRSCNQREAIKDYGQRKMDPFLFQNRNSEVKDPDSPPRRR